MSQTTVLIIGIFVCLLLATGIFLTIKEFRKMAREPEKYKQPAYDEDEELSEEQEDIIQE